MCPNHGTSEKLNYENFSTFLDLGNKVIRNLGSEENMEADFAERP